MIKLAWYLIYDGQLKLTFIKTAIDAEGTKVKTEQSTHTIQWNSVCLLQLFNLHWSWVLRSVSVHLFIKNKNEQNWLQFMNWKSYTRFLDIGILVLIVSSERKGSRYQFHTNNQYDCQCNFREWYLYTFTAVMLRVNKLCCLKYHLDCFFLCLLSTAPTAAAAAA